MCALDRPNRLVIRPHRPPVPKTCKPLYVTGNVCERPTLEKNNTISVQLTAGCSAAPGVAAYHRKTEQSMATVTSDGDDAVNPSPPAAADVAGADANDGAPPTPNGTQVPVPMLLPGLTPEQLEGGREGWVQKESKHLGEWRARWLILFRDRETNAPLLCSFKAARSDWAWDGDMPEPTSKLELAGCTCCMQSEAPTPAAGSASGGGGGSAL
eukprot:1084279-Prymnesium_polylepis.1